MAIEIHELEVLDDPRSAEPATAAGHPEPQPTCAALDEDMLRSWWREAALRSARLTTY